MDKNTSPSFLSDRISVIEINSVWFGVDILKSKEVIPLPSITPVPNTKEFIVGVFNLRGEIFPLVDISTILGMEAKPIKGSDMVIVLDGKSMTVGILVDRIHGVRTLDNVQVKPAHGIVSRQMEEFVSSVISEKSSVIYLLEIDRLFSTSLIRTYY